MAKLNAEIDYGKIEASLTKLYQTISEKQRLLSVENEILTVKQKNVDAAIVKYDRGMISKLDFNAVHNEYNTQASKIEVGKFNLFIAIEQYKWATNGMITG